MSKATEDKKTGSQTKSIDAVIRAQEEKLRKLKDKKKKAEQAVIDKNRLAIEALLRKKGLDVIPVEKWESESEAIKALLEKK